MKTTTATEPQRFTLYGNLGDDPKAHSIPAKTFTKMVYDEIIDDAVEKEFTYEERNFLTYSVATGGYRGQAHSLDLLCRLGGLRLPSPQGRPARALWLLRGALLHRQERRSEDHPPVRRRKLPDRLPEGSERGRLKSRLRGRPWRAGP